MKTKFHISVKVGIFVGLAAMAFSLVSSDASAMPRNRAPASKIKRVKSASKTRYVKPDRIGKPDRNTVSRTIEQKYAKQLDLLKRRQMRDEDRLMTKGIEETNPYLRKEQYRMMLSKHRMEVDSLHYRRSGELCSRLHRECEKVGQLTDAEDRRLVPTYARDSGFVYTE